MKKILCVLILLFFNVVSANAALVWDQSPEKYKGAMVDTTGVPINGLNTLGLAGSQYFVDRIQFDQDVRLTGMDIFSMNQVTPDTSVKIMIWTIDDIIGPFTPVFQLDENISKIDLEGTNGISGLTRKYADITSDVVLSAGEDYFVGMTASGMMGNIGQAMLSSSFCQYPGLDNFTGVFGSIYKYKGYQQIGDMAFRLHGETLPTPLPAAFWFLGSGFVGLLGFRRRKKAKMV